MEKSRSKNAIRNVKSGMIVELINKIMIFIVRTVFIKTLNSEYLGINALFTNILTILSFAELGIGTAIIFSMYKPVADGDKEKIKALMQLYKRAYRIIGTLIFCIGLCVIPFMRFIVKDAYKIKENIIFIYVLYLIYTSISYFYSYKKSIISAYQQQSIIDYIDSLVYLIKSILEIVLLICTKNFILYLVIEILSRAIENVIVSHKADKMFGFLKDKNIKKLEKNETEGIVKNVKSLMMYKIGGVVMTGTDNILISALVDLTTVGLCSDYTMIINSVKSIILSAINGVTASIGNLNTESDVKKKESIFYQMTFINYIIYSFCAVAFIVLLNPFINMWLGNEYVLNISISIALSVSFFIDGLRNPGYTYRTTLGLFQKAKFTPYIAAISNIILSIVFGKLWGVVGIFIATSVAQLISYVWIDPFIIHKYEFKSPVKKYFAKYLKYITVFIINIIICLFICSFIVDNGLATFIIKVCVVVFVPNILNYTMFYRSDEFRVLKVKFKDVIRLKRINEKGID